MEVHAPDQAEVPSFDGAPRWPIDQDAVRLRMSDRMVSRLPALVRRAGDRVAAAPRGSRLRRLLLTRGLVTGWAAHDARDIEYLRRGYSPEVIFEQRLEFLDLEGRYEGFDAMLGVLESWWEALAQDSRLNEIVDLGGRFFAASMTLKSTGTSSGIHIEQEMVQMYEVAGGITVHQWTCPDQADAEAALSERLAAAASNLTPP